MPNSQTTESMRTRDGRSLHVERSGAGGPTVVFEAGMGASRLTWAAVVPAVAATTTTVVYDRSGLGRSEPTDVPRDLAHLASDLVDVIGQLVDGPVVLVGHSWGGPIIRTAAAALPERVAGLVLVDQSDEHCELFFSRANAIQTRIMRPLVPVMARIGLVRVGVKRLAKQLPEPAASMMPTEDGTVRASRALVAELASHVDDLRRLREHPLTMPDIPVTAISGTQTGRMERGRRAELVAGHRTTIAAFPQGRHVEATESSHYVPFSEPDVIVDEILRIVDAVRASADS